MARSTKGLYKRGHVWWMTYCDAIGAQRFESCKTSNKSLVQEKPGSSDRIGSHQTCLIVRHPHDGTGTELALLLRLPPFRVGSPHPPEE